MKLVEFMIKDLSFFIETFVPPETAGLIQAMAKDMSVFKWGIGEPGRGGRIILCCDDSGFFTSTRYKALSADRWTVFFTFLCSEKSNAILLANLGANADIWADEMSPSAASAGFEVALSKNPILLELINAAIEI